MTANPAANNAKAANSSLTKYNCRETPAARNHHIHLRLLSSVLVIGLVSVPLVAVVSPYWMRATARSVCHPAPEPFDTLGKTKSMVQKAHFGTQTSFLLRCVFE